MADRLTAAEWRELDRLCSLAMIDPTTSDKSSEVLMGVSIYASRMAG